ncbi:MAG: glycosyltransferase, partial [Acidobacteriota bacterium]
CPARHKLLTHVSNFREVNRVKDVVRVFARVRRTMPAVLLMIGDGPERDDAERESRDLGVAGDVRFLGRIDAVAPLLQQSDLFLLPTQTESFGLAALDALACGVPVVGSRAGGLPELIRDGVEGILCDPRDPDALAGAIRRCLEDAGLRRRLAGNGASLWE